MDLIIKNRTTGEVSKMNQDKTLVFLYNNFFGRALLKVLCTRTVARIVGGYMSSRLSRSGIKRFILGNSIDMSMYEQRDYISFNDFFTREMKKECMNIDSADEALVSPCCSKLKVYKINKNSVFFIKGSTYNVEELLKNKDLADEYENGLCLVFRLSVDDYHRYCFFDDGNADKSVFIKGVLHTVNPIALGRYNYYKQNCREYTVLNTKHFGKAVQIEIGAMMVGKIVNHGIKSFKRGDEKGMFEFGGSTVVLLLKKNTAEIDGDILTNSAEGIETKIRIGERIGTSLKKEGKQND